MSEGAMTQWRKDNFTIYTDQSRFDLEVIHGFLTRVYWAEGVTKEVVQHAMRHSFAFGVFDGAAQVGYARIVTDFTRTAWLADVFILESHRKLGLGKWLIGVILEHPRLQTVRWLLTTDDAHTLYTRHGFREVDQTKFLLRPPVKHFNDALIEG